MPVSGAKASLAFCVGVVLFVGLPLLGWGIGDWRGFFFGEPARLIYVAVSVLSCAVAVALLPHFERRPGDERKRVRRQHLVGLALRLLTIAGMVAVAYDDRRAVAVLAVPSTRVVGVALFALGQALMIWAPLTLGMLFSTEVTVQDGHHLVTRGPYRWIRHPRYLGILLFVMGIALVFRSGVGLAFWGAVAIVLLWRIRDEEALMSREFGDERVAYARRSWMLVPGVY